MRLFIVALCIIFSPYLFSEEDNASAEAALLTPYIYNSVNVITGEYCETETDLSLSGPYGIKVRRHYSSFDPSGRWHFNLPNLLHTYGDVLSLPLSPYPVFFDYDQNKRLSSIKVNTKQNQPARQLNVRYEQGKNSCEIETDDGHRLTYQFNEKNELEKVILDDRTLSQYRYVQHPLTKQSQIVYCEKSPDNYLMNEYYQFGGNDVGGTRVVITEFRDQRIGKVMLQKAPLGSSEAPVIMHRFFYHNDYTEVFDASNNKVVYRFNEQTQRLTAIEHYGEDQKIYRVEQFFWDEQSESAPRMLSRSVGDGKGNIFICRTYAYDDKGQVVKETLYGNLTGNCSCPIVLQSNGLPINNGIESYAVQTTYGNEPLHLKVKQKEDNGTTVHYIYALNKSLLIGKLVEDGNGIKLRQFYDYDENDLLIATIIDDGSSTERDNLAGVTERRIRKFILRKQFPAIGQPEVIEERYLDLESGHEKLLAKTQCAYSKQGIVLQESFDGNGSLVDSQHISYNSQFRPTTISSTNSGTESYEYDAHGNKKSIVKRTPENKLHEIYNTYDGSNRLIHKKEITNDGQTISVEYLYDVNGNPIASIDGRGNRADHVYDIMGRIIEKHSPEVLDINGSPIRCVERKAYDLFNRVTANVDGDGYQTKTTYNARGKPIEVIHSDGTKDFFEYSLDGSLVKATNNAGMSAVYKYDFMAHPVDIQFFDTIGSFMGQTHAHYTPFHKISEIDVHGHQTNFIYDGAGRMESRLQQMDTGAFRTDYQYDALGKVCKQTESFGDSEQIVSLTEYGAHGEVVAKEVQDGAGNTLKKVEVHDETSTFEPNVIYADATNSIGQRVLQTTVTDESGGITVTLFDALNRVESVVKKNRFGECIAEQRMRYDFRGNKIKEEHTVYIAGKSTSTFVIEWKYGAENRLEEMREGSAVTRYQYDNGNRITKIIKPDGISICTEYDALGRVLSFYSSDNSFNYSYTYDQRNNVVSVLDAVHNNATSRSYNDLNCMTSETLGNGFSVAMQCDHAGRRTQLQLPDGSSIAYAYNPIQMLSVKRLGQDGQELYSHHYNEYDLTGNLCTAELAKGLGTLSLSYDKEHRLKGIQTPYWSEEIGEYNSAHNVMSLKITNDTESYAQQYEYDDLQQLVKVSGDASEEYLYDSIGNRLQKNSDECVVNNRNQVVQVGEDRYQYDLNGCLIEQTVNDQTTYYSYDALNRLIQVRQSDQQIDYIYDAFGRRISTTVTNGEESNTNHFLYEGMNEIGVLNQDGSFKALRVLGIGQGAEVGSSVAIELDNKVYVPVHDHRGTISCLVDAETKTIAESYRYTAFGEVQSASELHNPWQYSSKHYDEETKLIYYGQRYYSPHLGRWLTPDPMGFVDGVNRYAFLQNNPMSLYDLQGFYSLGSFWNSFTDAIVRMVTTINDTVSYLQDNLSYEKQLEEQCTMLGLKIFGKPYLAMSGYFEDSLEKGVYGQGELGNHVRVTAINGVLNIRSDIIETAEAISSSHGNVNIHYVFSPTTGWAHDMIKAIMAKLGYTSPQARLLAETWKQLIQEMGGIDGGGVIIHYAHSIGGTNTEMARRMLSVEEQKMIRVITVGSASLLPNEGFGNVMHYVSSCDGVALIASPLRFLTCLFNPDCNVILLESHMGIPLIDHLMNMETYRRLIDILGAEFLSLYGPQP